MGIYNFCNNKEEYVLKGVYLPYLTNITSDYEYPVDYDILDPRRVTFEDVIGNLPTQGARMAIRTKSLAPYATNGYFKAQDGRYFQVVDITINPVKENKKSLAVFKKSVQTEYVLRLVEYDYDGGAI